MMEDATPEIRMHPRTLGAVIASIVVGLGAGGGAAFAGSTGIRDEVRAVGATLDDVRQRMVRLEADGGRVLDHENRLRSLEERIGRCELATVEKRGR